MRLHRDGGRAPASRPSKVGALLLGVLLAGLAGCAVTPPPATPGPTDTGFTDRNTASVIRQDLTTRDEFPGRFGYAGSYALLAGRDGTLTWLPAVGAVLQRGDAVMEIDGVFTRLLIGARPAWRQLSVDEPSGPDIAQLNANLAALGYARADALPDKRFDWRTREAVRRWQHDLGRSRTGVVEPGDVVFLPSTVRVGRVEAVPGTPVGPGQPVATLTDTVRVVTMDLPVAYRDRLGEGSPVVVVLPDRAEVGATVSSVGRAATAGPEPGDDPTVPVVIALDGSQLAGDLDAAPVQVRVDRVLVEDALTVPVSALLARSGDGYAVERITEQGTELVAVEPGRFAEGLVEVTGDIEAGDEVVVP